MVKRASDKKIQTKSSYVTKNAIDTIYPLPLDRVNHLKEQLIKCVKNLEYHTSSSEANGAIIILEILYKNNLRNGC